MENCKNLGFKLFSLVILNGLIYPFFVFAYDQDNTHPALTDEIVDFYNLSYPEKPILEEFKQLMIRGAIEEDEDIRPLNHFYDPIHNKGFAAYKSSKEWALNSEHQEWNLAKYAAIFEVQPSVLENTTYGDYSYQQAIEDYAKGDKKRAFRALGHTLHLLEDANVPDHTRDDPHPPIHSAFGSPYESEMVKWSPLNTNIAKPLFDKGAKPIIFNDISRYFDEVAFYSNSNFFSEDTIFADKYKSPKVLRKINRVEDGLMYRFGLGRDKNGDEYHLIRYGFSIWRNVVTEQDFTVNSKVVLNDYWSRLSNHLIPHGAGLVRVFLAQAQEAEKLYSQRKVEEPRLGFFQKFISAINPFASEAEKAETQNEQTVSEIASDILDGEIAVDVQEEPKPETEKNISIFRDADITPPAIAPAISPVPAPNPSPTPNVSPSLTPFPSVSPSPALTPALSPSPPPAPAAPAENSSCAEPVLKTNEPLRQVVINEIAWMGTEFSANDEWLELKNSAGREIDLNCWQIIAEDGTPKIRLSSKIGSDNYYLLERTDDNTIKDVAADQIYTGALGNSGEILKLYDKDGNLQDLVDGWHGGDNSTKSSMERRDSSAAGNSPASWQTNSGITRNGQDNGGNPINGTPKAKNSWSQQSGGGGGTANSETAASESGDSGGTAGTGGSEGGDKDVPLFRIVINEIAWMGTKADDTDEWMEIYNPVSQSVNLGGWTLKASGSPDIILATKSLDPFGYFLLERTSDTTISDIPADQIYTGALGNDGEVLELRDPAGQLQDKVDKWHAGENKTSPPPLIRKTMERISPDISGTEPTNWQTNNGIIRNGLDKNGNMIFGTPKKKNSEEYGDVLANSVWPMFGHNKSHTGQVSINGPNNASISWQYDFNSSNPSNNLPFHPVISVNGSIYIIHTNSGGNGNLSVISKSGQLEWKWPQSGTYTLNRKSAPAVLADKTVYLGVVNSVYAVASPATDKWSICTASPSCNGLKAGPITIDSKGNLYFADENQNFQAVKADGSLKWKVNFLTAYSSLVFNLFGYAPVIDEDANTLYLAAATTSGLATFLAFDLNTGAEKWRTVWPDAVNSITSHISFDKAGNKLYAAGNNNLFEINPANGEISQFPIVSDGQIRQPKSLVSIDLKNNALLVGFDYSSIPASGSDKLSASTKTKLFSFNKTAKAKNWSYEIPLNLAGNMITVDNSGNLYFAGEDVGIGVGRLYSLDKDGGLRWEMDGGEASQDTSPVIDSEGAIYQVFGFKLYKIRP